VVIMEAWPVYFYLSSRLRGETALESVVPLVLGVSGALVLTLVAIVAPLWAGIRRVRAVEV
jgi:hypothetical protein